MSKTQTICRKIKMFPVGDKEEINRAYQFIRDGQYAQYRGLNLLMGQYMSEYYKVNMDIKNEDFKKWQKSHMTNSNPIFEEIEFAKGVDTKSAITQKVKQDFSTALKNGLAKGERSIANYKRTTPLITRGRVLKFEHCYSDYQEFLENINKRDLQVQISWVNKIKFDIIFGNPRKSQELRTTVQRILEGIYKVQGSSIEIDGKEIILNLSIQIPVKEHELDENTVVGVDLGVAIPAVCGLNNNSYIKESIGSSQDLLRVRTQLQAQRKRLQRNLTFTAGGHGRSKKLRALDKMRNRETNFVQTYNHLISKRVVDFALENNAKYINMEDLSGFDTNQFILRNWSYYQLQQYITYKAELHGIVVRKVNPYHTSQICSCCGHWEEGQRKTQSQFVCGNCGVELNADFNASRNIAKSIDFR